ncbi:MAG: type IV secretion system DNA-binding domain-containing protein, partial [Desulfobacula sp.]|nr:type IV secretion system DNA-binding domain-containing protein [Desulfobacula sp.]
FVMLTGEIGIGKTTLIRYMLNQVEAGMDVAVIFNTNIRSNRGRVC